MFSRFTISAIILSSCIYSNKLVGVSPSDRYSQIVMPFTSSRPYNYYYNAAKNTIVIQIKDTSSEELSSLNTYDDDLIRRVLIKDHDSTNTEIHLTLKDPGVRATITDFSEPFRIVVDIFDQSFSPLRDQKTGLPVPAVSNQQTLEMALLGGQQPYNQPSDKPRKYQEAKPYIPTQRNTPISRKKTTQAPTRRLLQPSPNLYANPNDLANNLSKVPPGKGKAWDQFPIYVSRAQLATYKTGKSYSDFINKNAHKAVRSTQAMADYAGKLFDFGDEGRALIAYKQVIHKAPLIFDKNPLHLWRLAEIHLGQGNLNLADSYYQSMTEKHPDHPLSNYAHLRRLDIIAIKANTTRKPNL